MRPCSLRSRGLRTSWEKGWLIIAKTIVHTVNARDNFLLELLQDEFNLASGDMLRVIQGMV